MGIELHIQDAQAMKLAASKKAVVSQDATLLHALVYLSKKKDGALFAPVLYQEVVQLDLMHGVLDLVAQGYAKRNLVQGNVYFELTGDGKSLYNTMVAYVNATVHD